jgi:hypothetical protein
MVMDMNSREDTVTASERTCLIEYDVDRLESTTHAVVEAVAAVHGRDVNEMPTLYDALDTEALDQLVAPRANATPRSDVTVRFVYCGTLVTVNGTTVEVHPVEG